jgi:acetylornithine deacetylase/succinyl-diaminopimelate desuccinylase-like protein
MQQQTAAMVLACSVHGVDERLPLDQLRNALQMYYDMVTKLAGAGTGDVNP